MFAGPHVGHTNGPSSKTDHRDSMNLHEPPIGGCSSWELHQFRKKLLDLLFPEKYEVAPWYLVADTAVSKMKDVHLPYFVFAWYRVLTCTNVLMEYPHTSDFWCLQVQHLGPLQQWLSVDACSSCIEYLSWETPFLGIPIFGQTQRLLFDFVKVDTSLDCWRTQLKHWDLPCHGAFPTALTIQKTKWSSLEVRKHWFWAISRWPLT